MPPKAHDSNEPVTALTFEQLKELMAAAKPEPAQQFSAADLAAAVAAGVDKWKPHEIRRPEQRSVYNPDGDRDYPRPRLKCHIYVGSYPLGDPNDNRTLTRAEIEALNALTPGHYRVLKHDGSKVVIEIRGQVDANQRLERLWVILPEGEKNAFGNWPHIAAQCVDANRVNNPLVAA